MKIKLTEKQSYKTKNTKTRKFQLYYNTLKTAKFRIKDEDIIKVNTMR